MRQTLLLLVVATVCTALTAQTRYLGEVFADVTVDAPMQYQNNVSVLPAILSGGQNPPSQVPDFFQAYYPTNDTATNRPAVILNTTGSYFPQLVGGGLFGTLQDSAVVNVARRFARMGYVAFVATYRQGWIPTSMQVDERTGSLLIASYRGLQDMRSMTRFIRNNADDYGVNGDAIMAMGFGTGAYNVYNNNFLDDPSEVNVLPKFISSMGQPYLIPQAFGDPDGLMQAQLNIPQNVGADSRVQFSAAIGGAMGDTTWVDGNANEAPIVALHSINDRNAPFAAGDVFVPISPTASLFVINVAGPRATVDKANRVGVNSELDAVNSVLIAAGDFLTLRSEALVDVDFTTRDNIETTLSVENLYPFVSDPALGLANRYNYIDSAQLDPIVRGFNMQTGETLTTAQRLAFERISNPNITSPVRANMVIDTIMGFVAPRAFVALDLGTAQDVAVAIDVVDIQPTDVDFEVFPNPVKERAVLRVRDGVEMQLVALYDAQGRRVAHRVISGNQYGLERGSLPAGHYTLMVQTTEGALSAQVLFQ